MTVSMVFSYSWRSADSCLFSWNNVWFSMTICAFCLSSSDSNVSAGKADHQSLRRVHMPSAYAQPLQRTFRDVQVDPAQGEAARDILGFRLTTLCMHECSGTRGEAAGAYFERLGLRRERGRHLEVQRVLLGEVHEALPGPDELGLGVVIHGGRARQDKSKSISG